MENGVHRVHIPRAPAQCRHSPELGQGDRKSGRPVQSPDADPSTGRTRDTMRREPRVKRRATEDRGHRTGGTERSPRAVSRSEGASQAAGREACRGAARQTRAQCSSHGLRPSPASGPKACHSQTLTRTSSGPVWIPSTKSLQSNEGHYVPETEIDTTHVWLVRSSRTQTQEVNFRSSTLPCFYEAT